MEGEDVALLQQELQQLGFTIAEEEVARRFVGESTREAVTVFQRQHGLEPATAAGVVDEPTAQAINAAVDAQQLGPFVVLGTVRDQNGDAVPAIVVRAFARELRREELLGEAATNEQGAYEISYTPQSQNADTRPPNLRIVAFSERGERLGSSDIRFNAREREVIDVTVAPSPPTSEYERLLDAIAPAAGETPLTDLTDADLDFLSGSANVDRKQLEFLVQAARLALGTELVSPAVFYGFLRLDQPPELKALLAQGIPVLRELLLAAIGQGIIPARIRDNLDAIMARLAQLRSEQDIVVPVTVHGRLLDQETGEPLPGLSIKVIDLADSPSPVIIEDTATNEEGEFAFAYLAENTDPPGGDGNSRTFRFSISRPGQDEFHAIDATVDGDEVLELHIPTPPSPAPVPLVELAERVSLELPEGLLSALASRGITTIEDLRAAGPLDRLVELPEEPGEGVRKLEAHVRLSTLSSDIEANDTLIDAGYTGAAAIAHAPRLEFINAASAAVGDFGAAKTYTRARVLNVLLDHVAANGRVVAWHPNAGSSTDDVGDNLIDDVADLFPTRCHCTACSNASSPLAYLADLLDYAQNNLKRFAEGATTPASVTVDDLSDRFHQPFDDLPATCDQVSREVNQVRICVEVLRRFLADARTPQRYLERAYTIVLSGIGSSFEEIRDAHSADTATRQALADKLGIVLGPDRPDLLDALFLPPESLTEQALEQLFGLVDTTRDPLQSGSTPAFLNSRFEFLRAAWREADDTTERPIIDADLIGPGYLKEPVPGDPAYDLWQARFDDIQAQVESLREARNTATSDLTWLDESVQQVLGVTGEDLFALQDRLNGGENVDAELAALHLAFDAFSRLVRLRRVLVDGDPILDREADDIVSILVQARKQGRYTVWRQEERDAGILLSPDHFILPEPPQEFPPPEPQPLPEWRAAQDDLRAWRNVLRSRMEEEASATEVLESAVRTAEEEALPMLRDGLIATSGWTARQLTQQLLIDCEADGCYRTTRIAQAIQTVQGMLWAIRTGQLTDAHPDLELVDDDFDTAWRWLGSYETWQAAMSVFLYPENTLLPSLRPYKTPAFERLLEQTRANRRITPAEARRLAHEYEAYFLDIVSLSLGATCTAATRIYSGDQRGKMGKEVRDLFYTFATSEATQTIYWSSFDPEDESGYAQSFWHQIPDVKHVSRIDGAVPYSFGAQERYIYVFFTTELDDRKQLYYIRMNLEQEDYPWDAEPTPITFQEETTDWKVVIKQSKDDQKPPELVAWISPPSNGFSVVRGVLTRADNAPNYHVKHWISVLENRFIVPLAMVPWGENGFVLFTGLSEGQQLRIHFHSGTGNQGGTQGSRTLTSSSGGVESWRGAFRWPQSENLVYAFWEEGGRVQYAAIWGTDTPVQEPTRFPSAPLQGLEYIAPHSGSRTSRDGSPADPSDRLTTAYQTAGAKGGLFRSVLQRVSTGTGARFMMRRSDPRPITAAMFQLDNGIFDGNPGGVFDPGPGSPPPTPPPDPPPPDSLQVSEQSRTRIAPLVAHPLELVERLSESELQIRRGVMAGTFGDNKHVPSSTLTYLEEAYYFVPVHLALQLQRGDHFIESLDWFRTVFNYSADLKQRKIYHGLRVEEAITNTFERLQDWLLDPLTPHTIASTRRNTYTRFTVLSIIRCFLQYADREFTRDTAESVARARTLYLTALDLLGPSEQQSDPCELLIIDLDRDVRGPIIADNLIWTPVWDLVLQDLRRLDDMELLNPTVEAVRATMQGEQSLPVRLARVREIIAEARNNAPETPVLGEIITERAERANRLHALLQKESRLVSAEGALAAIAGNDLLRTVAQVTRIDADQLEHDKSIELPWLRQRMTMPDDALVVLTLAGNGFFAGNNLGRTLAERAFASPRSHFDERIAQLLPLQLVNSRKRYANVYLPASTFSFCVPVNPVVETLRFHAELNLYKIRTCRNIAGDRRDLEPYATVQQGRGGFPAIGADVQFVLPSTVVFSPAPYRYAVLIERAKQLVGLAQQMEAALLTTLEKLDAEELNLLRARQESALSQAGVQLQALRLREAEDGVVLAELQRDRAQIQADHYDGLLKEGRSELELAALAAMQISAALTLGAAIIPSPVSLSGLGQAASQEAQALLQHASFERREQEWKLALNLAEQDILIGDQQRRIARDQVRVVAQERMIASLHASHAQETLEFLANKFTNAELYEYMSNVLEGVYRFFLQLATATAQLAASQLAFERQQALPAIIQSDYWEVPSEGSSPGFGTDNIAPDRRGITGSAHLLQDIFRLDQFAFDTDQRKLQLTKTIALARFSPIEFQRFRQTGVLRFTTPFELFDHDFPGHYLRLIKRARVSVIALIPPTEGIKATLATTGLSRVVIGNNGLFETIQVRRSPESIALSSPLNATGLFDLAPQAPEMLYPFEGTGVDTAWEFQMPKAANLFDYSTIADVLLTFEYTALNSYTYRQQVIRELDRSISADRPFSFRQELADQFYDFNNPDQTDTPMVVRFTTRRADFPPNLEELRIQHVALFFARAEDTAFEVPVTHLHFTEQGGATAGGGATSIDGVISTRRGNAGSWTAMLGKSPIGAWELALPNTEEVRNRFKNEEIADILFVITYSGFTPAWPA
jgi:hypothetical protein